MSEFLADYNAESVLVLVVSTFNVLAKRSIHGCLVVAPTGRMNLSTEPPQDIVVNPNRDSRLAGQ
jgi:hypothetical protein